MNRDTYYALCHEARFAKWAERERRRKKRELKRAHKAWRRNQLLNAIRKENEAMYAHVFRLAAIFG